MTQPIDYITPGIPLDFRNRKNGLIAFGIIMIVIGSMLGCLSLVAPLAIAAAARLPSAASRPREPTHMLIAGVFIYVIIATGLIWTGIGSIQAKRWVRPIVLVYSVLTVVIGVSTMITLLMAIPAMKATMQTTATPGRPAAALMAGSISGILFGFVFMIVIPIIFFRFYRDDNVLKTLEHYDRAVRWTDDRPLPVLALSIAAATFAIGTLFSIFYLYAGVFGLLVTGIAAAIVHIIYAAIFFFSAVLIYRRRVLGLWLAVTAMSLQLVSAIVTFLLNDSATIAAAAGVSPQAMRMTSSLNRLLPWSMLVGIVGIGYAIWARKFFHQTNSEIESPTEIVPPSRI